MYISSLALARNLRSGRLRPTEGASVEPSTRELTAIRFGVFEVDLHTKELRKNGFKVKLVGQPFEVLAMLLERPGELVTREEFEKRLWSGDTFVDFEHGLNAAV